MTEAGVALITGGSRGIGAAIAGAAAKRGYMVAILYRDRDKDANAVVSEIVKVGGRALAIRADIAGSVRTACTISRCSTTASCDSSNNRTATVGSDGNWVMDQIFVGLIIGRKTSTATGPPCLGTNISSECARSAIATCHAAIGPPRVLEEFHSKVRSRSPHR